MTIEELQKKLTQMSVPSEWYNLTGDPTKTADAVTLEEVEGYWHVMRRNERNGLQSSYWFKNVSDACVFVHALMYESKEFLKRQEHKAI